MRDTVETLFVDDGSEGSVVVVVIPRALADAVRKQAETTNVHSSVLDAIVPSTLATGRLISDGSSGVFFSAATP